MAVTFSLLTQGSSTSNVTSYATGTVTPVADSVLFACLAHTGTGAPTVSSISGWGLTWTEVATKRYPTDTTGVNRVSLWMAVVGGSPTSGSATITMSASSTGCAYAFITAEGVDTSNPVVQSATANGTSISTLTVDLASATSATNRPLAVFGGALATNNSVTPRANWTELAEAHYSTPAQGVEVQVREDAFEITASATWSSAVNQGGIAVELADASSKTVTPVTATATSHVPRLKPSNATQTDMDNAISSAWTTFKTNYLKQNAGQGWYAVDIDPTLPASGEIHFVPESTGYGMLLSVCLAPIDANAQTIFNGLLKFALDKPSVNESRFMGGAFDLNWALVGVQDSATDGDLDIALACILAARYWGDSATVNSHTYAYWANDRIAGLKASGFSSQHSLLRLGDWSSGAFEQTSRPSDWMFDHFEQFYLFTGDSFWQTAASNHLEAVQDLITDFASSTSLIPDFATGTTRTTLSPGPASVLEGPEDDDYYYNSCRLPWRFAAAENATVNQIATAMTQWVKGKYSGSASAIESGWQLNGTTLSGSNYQDNSFIAPFMAGAAVGTDQTWLNSLWTYVAANASSNFYYPDALTLLAMIQLSGTYWRRLGPVDPSVTTEINTGTNVTPTDITVAAAAQSATDQVAPGAQDVAVTAAAQNATISTSKTVTAGLAGATGTASNATISTSKSVTPGVAGATGVANSPTISTSKAVPATLAGATGTANNTTSRVALGSTDAAASSAALAPQRAMTASPGTAAGAASYGVQTQIGTGGQSATAGGSAGNATIQIGGNTTVNAVEAVATGLAGSLTAQVRPSPLQASGTAVLGLPGVTATFTAQAASGSAAAQSPRIDIVVNGATANAVADGAGNQLEAAANPAIAGATAHNASITVQFGAGTAVATGSAQNATASMGTTAQAELAGVSAGGLDVTGSVNSEPQTAAGGGLAGSTSRSVVPTAEAATSSGLAQNATVSVTGATNAIAQVAAGGASAFNATVAIDGSPIAGLAGVTAHSTAVTGTTGPTVANSGAFAENAGISTSGNANAFPPPATAMGAAGNPSVSTTEKGEAGAALVTGSAIDATVNTSVPAGGGTASAAAADGSVAVESPAGAPASSAVAQAAGANGSTTPAVAPAGAAALNPVVTTSGNTNAIAQNAGATGVAHEPSVLKSAIEANASASAVNPSVSTSETGDATTATASGVAENASVDLTKRVNAGTAGAGGAALGATIRISQNVPAAEVAAQAQAAAAGVLKEVVAQAAGATGTAYGAAVTRTGNGSPQVAAITAAALNARVQIGVDGAVATSVGRPFIPKITGGVENATSMSSIGGGTSVALLGNEGESASLTPESPSVTTVVPSGSSTSRVTSGNSSSQVRPGGSSVSSVSDG